MLGKSRIAMLFQWFVVPAVRKVGSAAGAEAAVQQRHEKRHAAVAQVKMRKAHQLRSHFGRSDLEKWHAAVARSTFHLSVKMCKTSHCRIDFAGSDPQKWYAAVARRTFVSKNAQNTACSEHFWQFRCPKIARTCGAKHICKSKCPKHLRFRTLSMFRYRKISDLALSSVNQSLS